MTAVMMTRCEGSGDRVWFFPAVCQGCGREVRQARTIHDTGRVGPRALRCSFEAIAKPSRIPEHDRVDLVSMLRAGAFDGGRLVEQLELTL